jgi:hypothetical protein
MAVSTDTYFNNAMVGQTQVGGGQKVCQSSASPAFAVGTMFIRSDGNIFRYTHFGAATVAGAAVATDISESCLADTDNSVIAPASAVSVAGETMKPGAIGSHYIQMTVASVTADQYAGGYLVVTDDTGEGHTYRVKGNTATDDPVTGDILINLWEPIRVALDATSDVAIQGCRWANVEPATTTDYDCCGVSMTAQDAGDYGWVCSKGVVGYLDAGGNTAGQALAVSATAGALSDKAAATEVTVGRCLLAGDDTGFGVMYINVD